MTNYNAWNRAIANYFTQNVPQGTKIYLSLDDDVLQLIGDDFEEECTEQSWCENFCKAVKSQVVSGTKIEIDSIAGIDEEDYPKGVAFLGLMVLAANEMARDMEKDDERKISDKNYFTRFREILKLPNDGQTRPLGLRINAGEEAPEIELWSRWNKWLLKQGFIPTAQEGAIQRNRYINYPLSQSLLRKADKDRLRKVFTEKK